MSDIILGVEVAIMNTKMTISAFAMLNLQLKGN